MPVAHKRAIVFGTLLGLAVIPVAARAQDAPSYARHIRPILAKYCLECHNPKSLKGGLDLESFKGIREGGGKGVVLVPGHPEKSRLVTLTEGTLKPQMPPKTAKHQPRRDEIALLRAWVQAGARDDSSLVKVTLPDIKPRRVGFPPVTALAFRPADGRLAIARLNRVEHYPAGLDFEADGERVTALAFSDAGDMFAHAYGSPGLKGSVYLNKGPDLEPVRLDLHEDVILDMAISPDGAWLATSSYDTRVSLVPMAADPLDKRKSIVLKDHSDAVYGVAFSPDSKLLATCSADRAVKVWDVATGSLTLTLGEANDWLYAVAWSGKNRLAAGGLDRSIRLYEIDAGKARLMHSVFAHEAGVLKLFFSRAGDKLYSLGQEGVVKVWNAHAMKELRVLERQPENVLSLAVSPDDRRIAMGRYDGMVLLYDEATGKKEGEIKPKAKKAAKEKEPPEKMLDPPDPFPLQKEAGDNDSPGKAMSVALPVSVHGLLDRAGDCDYFRVAVKKGEQLGVQALAAPGSKLEPYLEILDAGGSVLAASGNGLLGHTFAEAGVYVLGIRDRELKGGAAYRLHLGAIPIVRGVYPLGLQRGKEADFQIHGVFIDQATVRFKVPADAAPGTRLDLPLTSKHGKVLGRKHVVVGEFADVVSRPDAAEGRLTAHPATASGVLHAAGAADTWRFPATKGQRLILEVDARRLGSPLDSVIEVLDAEGRPVERAVLRCLAKTFVTFRDHDSVQGNVRIEAWNDLAVNDHIYVGGQLLKIQALPTHPDADCNFFTAGGLRTAFLDTTPTHLALNEPMYKVGIHPPGSTFAPNGFPVFSLFYRNDDGGPGYGRDSRLFFDPPRDGEYMVRIRDASGEGGPTHGYRLTVRLPQPSFNVRFTPDAPAVWRGSALPVTVTADRIDGYEGPIQIALEGLPEGWHAPTTDIAAGLNSTSFALFADEKATLPIKPAPLRLLAFATVDGKKIVRQVVGGVPKLVDPGDIVTRTVESEITLRPGGITRLTVEVERRGGFTGRIPLEVRGLPHGVRVLDIGLNGILITEGETRRTIQIFAEPWVEPTQHPIVVLSKREGKNTEHGAKSVLLNVAK